MDNLDDLFVRNKIDINNHYTELVRANLNLKTINNWSKAKTKKFYNTDYEKWYLAYRFKVLKEWFNANKESLNSNFLNKLNKLINNLYLNQYLNAKEQNYLFNLANLNFTKLRNIKSLMTDFDLSKNEIVCFHYLVDKFIFLNKNYYHVNFYISNQRLIIVTGQNIISFYFKYLHEFCINDSQLIIYYFKHQYVLTSHKINIIITSLERIKTKYGWKFETKVK